MLKKTVKDVQLSFEFETENRTVKFIAVSFKCKCGFTGEFKKADVVLEMTAPCPKCGTLITIK